MKKIRLVHNFGVNDANYPVMVKTLIKNRTSSPKYDIQFVCAFHRVWIGMLSRVTATSAPYKHPTYQDCSIVEEWRYFSNFKHWMEKQPWVGMELDKDLLVVGNKVYSPDTCCFIPKRLNSLLNDNRAVRGEYPMGVNYRQKGKDMINEFSRPFRARINILDKRVHLGHFATTKEAHRAWQKAKVDVIYDAVNWWQFDSTVSHTFNQKAAESLFLRAETLKEDCENGVETLKL